MKKIGIFLFLMTTLILFTGCPNPNLDLQVDNITVSGNKVKESNGSIFEIFSRWYDEEDLLDVKANLTVNSNVGSFKLIQQESKPGSITDYTKTTKYQCYSPKTSTPYEELKDLRFNYDYKLTFELYKSKNCSGTPYQTVVRRARTYPGTSDVAKIMEIVGEEGYCNFDSNGNYHSINAMPEDKNLFADIAYSQVGYSFDESYNAEYVQNCGGTGAYFSKYGLDPSKRINNYDRAIIDFVNWVAKKANVKWPKHFNSVKQLVDWAKDNKRFNANNTINIHAGDILVRQVGDQTQLYIVYTEQGNGVKYNNVIGLNDYIGVSMPIKGGEATRYSGYLVDATRGDEGPTSAYFTKKVSGYISMSGIAY